VASTNFHEAIVSTGTREAANFFGRLVNQLGSSKLVYVFHLSPL
jgi:hypothetical protein